MNLPGAVIRDNLEIDLLPFKSNIPARSTALMWT